MSFFDTVQCEYPLPDPAFQHTEFRTHDLGDRLRRYVITADGRLWRRRGGVQIFGETEHTLHFDALEEDMHYHGDFRLYASTAKGPLEYTVRFTRGVVEWIRRLEFEGAEAADSLERLTRDAADLEQERAVRLEGLLQRLEVIDPEVAKQAVFVFGNRSDAARWLTSTPLALDRRSPYAELARGRRKEILNVLGRILHGIPS